MKVNEPSITYAFRQDAEGHVEIIEVYALGDTILWDVRFSTQAEANAAVATSKRRRQCKTVWGLAA